MRIVVTIAVVGGEGERGTSGGGRRSGDRRSAVAVVGKVGPSREQTALADCGRGDTCGDHSERRARRAVGERGGAGVAGDLGRSAEAHRGLRRGQRQGTGRCRIRERSRVPNLWYRIVGHRRAARGLETDGDGPAGDHGIVGGICGETQCPWQQARIIYPADWRGPRVRCAYRDVADRGLVRRGDRHFDACKVIRIRRGGIINGQRVRRLLAGRPICRADARAVGDDDFQGRTGAGGFGPVRRVGSREGGRGGVTDRLERHAERTGAGGERRIGGQVCAAVTGFDVHGVADAWDHVEELVHGVDGALERSVDVLDIRCSRLAGQSSRRRRLARHQQLELAERGGVHGQSKGLSRVGGDSILSRHGDGEGAGQIRGSGQGCGAIVIVYKRDACRQAARFTQARRRDGRRGHGECARRACGERRAVGAGDARRQENAELPGGRPARGKIALRRIARAQGMVARAGAGQRKGRRSADQGRGERHAAIHAQ